MATQVDGKPVAPSKTPVPPPKKRRRWIAPLIGAVLGVMIAMAAVSVGTEMSDKTQSNAVFSVWVFGAKAHQETVTYTAQELATGISDWRGPVWGISLTAVFAVVGGLLGMGLMGLRKRPTEQLPTGAFQAR